MDKQVTLNKIEQLLVRLSSLKLCVQDEGAQGILKQADDLAIQIRQQIRKA